MTDAIKLVVDTMKREIAEAEEDCRTILDRHPLAEFRSNLQVLRLELHTMGENLDLVASLLEARPQ